MLGKLLQGRYQVIQVLGAGGFCHTYLAQDTRRPGYPTCVVKHLKPVSNHPDSLQTIRQLFTREAEALKKLGNHNQVPQLLAHFEENLEFYLVQEFICGHPLSAQLLPGQRWTESQVVQLLQEVLGILEFVHHHGLIHQDIKPSNLIRRQQDLRLVLVNFGSLTQVWTKVVAAQAQTSTTIAIGTPGYMPTEQGRGWPRPNSDIYALGIIGIQALTGLHPTQLLKDSDTGEFIWQQQAKVSVRLALACFLNRMVRYHSSDRYQSATEALQVLQPIANFYQLPQPETNSCQPSTQQEAPQKPSLTAAPMPQAPPSGQDTIPVFPDNLSKPLLGDKTSDASVPDSPNKYALLIGLTIGAASAIVIMIGAYYSLRTPAPAPKVEWHAR